MKPLCCLLWLCLTSACASLSHGPVKSINDYAKLSASYTQYPVRVVEQCVDLQYEIDLVAAGSFDKDVLYEKLENSYKGKKQALASVKKLEQSLQILNEYAKTLVALSSPDPGKNVDTNAATLGSNLENLITSYNKLPDTTNRIPAGVGMLLAAAVRQAGGRYVRSRQVKLLRQYLTHGDTLVSAVSLTIQNQLWTKVLQEWTPVFKTRLQSNQRVLMSRLQPKPSKGNTQVSSVHAWYANEYASKVAALIEKIGETEALAEESLLSAQQLPMAHKALVKELTREKTEAESIREVENLYNSVRELTDLYKKIKN